jgi:flagellar biosynthesis protein FlhA
VLLARVREALGSSIVQRIYGLRDELPVISLDPALEKILRDSAGGTEGSPGLEPSLGDRLHAGLARAAQELSVRGEPAVLLVAGALRPWLAKLTRYSIPGLSVLAYGEIPHDRTLQVITSVGGH